MAEAKVTHSDRKGVRREEGQEYRVPARFTKLLLEDSVRDKATRHLAEIHKACTVGLGVRPDVFITMGNGKRKDLFEWIASELGEDVLSAIANGKMPGDEPEVCDYVSKRIVALIGKGEKPILGLYEPGGYVPGILPETLKAVELVSNGGPEKEKRFNALHPLREALESLLHYVDSIRHAIGSGLLEEVPDGSWGKSRED